MLDGSLLWRISVSRYYYSWEEKECYDEGRRDQERGRTNYDHDRYSDCSCDRAYFEGKRDEERAEERRREEREEEEHQQRRDEERRQYNRMLERQQEEEQYQRYEEEREQEQQQYEEQQYVTQLVPPNIKRQER